ncbi:Rho GTPase activation protein, partial [Catenaria anguillulae PL171]
MQRADARRYAVEAFLVQLLAVVCESPFGPLTQQLVDLVASDLHDPTTTVFSPEAAPVSGANAGAVGVEGIATPSSALAPGGSDEKGFGQGLFGQDGGIGRLFKKSSNNPIGKSTGAAVSTPASARPNGVSPAGGNSGRNRVFGTPLEMAIAVSRIKEGVELPAVVYRCIEYLDAQNASNEEGIYRLSGNGDYDLIHSGEYIDVHAVAGLLKLFFRELPGSILTEQYHPYFM